MIIDGDKILTKIADKQFEILGVKMKFSEIPEHGVVTYMDGKKEKKDYWYNVYKFTEEQEEEWRKWAREEISKEWIEEEAERVFRHMDLCYGFVIRYKRKGELF